LTALIVANKAIEQIILNGQLRSYGLEYLKRTKGDLMAGSHTISKSEQRTPGRTPTESGINNEWYKSVYDKLHLALSDYKLRLK
jgi:hypothetical protein